VTDPYLIVWTDESDRLRAAARHDGEWYRAVAASLARPGVRLAVDVGCGGAGMAIALAGALPAEARVMAIDGDDGVLAGAAANIDASGVPRGRIELQRFDLGSDLSGLRALIGEPVDVVWASAVVHHVGDQQTAVDGLARLLAPGGRLALAESGLRPHHLPWDVGIGEPGLELRLHAAEYRWFAGMRERLPGRVAMPYGWTEALGRAGLRDVTTRSALIETPAPLTGSDLDHVVVGFRRRVDRVGTAALLDDADRASWDRLLDPEDRDWLGHRTDLFTLDVRSVHVGTAPGAGSG
jgi:SAM-dependent methyltransferase